MSTELLPNGTDCNVLTETGTFEIVSPVNGPSAVAHILIEVIAPAVKIRPDNVKQHAWDVANDNQYTRHYVNGTGWTAWAAEGGGGASTTDGMTNSNTVLDSIASAYTGQASFSNFTALVGAAPSNGNRLDVILNILGVWGAKGYSYAGQLAPIVQQTRDPTATDDQTHAVGVIVMLPGIIWVNTTSHDVFICVDGSTGAAVWRKISFLT